MIDIDIIVQNIENKINFLEKLKFEDDSKNFMYTPIKGVTITSSTNFKQLECQKFVRCARSNKLIPLEKYKDTVVALKDENSDIHVSTQHKRNYRRNSVAAFNQKVLSDSKTSLIGKRRRNSTKFDINNPSDVQNGNTTSEIDQKKLKVNPENPQKVSKLNSAYTSSPLLNPRASLTSKAAKPDNKNQNPIITGSPKFSRSYTEFLSNLNKDMQIFKEQQKRNEPCDNFLGKNAKIFVEDPISKFVGGSKDQKVTSSGSSSNNIDTVKSNGNADKIPKVSKVTESKINSNDSKIPQKKIEISKDPAKKVEQTKINPDVKKIPDSPPKTPIYGMKYLVKAAKPQPEPSQSIFGKIIKNPVENAPNPVTKSLNKLVMRRMTIDSGWNSKSLTLSSPNSKIQKIDLQKVTSTKDNSKSPEKQQKSDMKFPKVNPDLIHQSIIRLSPQKPQSPSESPKPQQIVLKNLSALRHKIPRRNSIGYGVRIETVNDIKRLKMSQDVRKSLELNIAQDLAKIEKKEVKKSQNLQKREEKSFQNVGTADKLDKKSLDVKMSSLGSKLKGQLTNSTKIVKNLTTSDPTDYEDELANIPTCHIDKLSPKGAVNEDQTNISKIDANPEDYGHKSISTAEKIVVKRIRKSKYNKSALDDDKKLEKPKTVEKLDQNQSEVKKKYRKFLKNFNVEEKSIKEVKSVSSDKQLSNSDQKNNNLEQTSRKNQNDESSVSIDIKIDSKDSKLNLNEGSAGKLIKSRKNKLTEFKKSAEEKSNGNGAGNIDEVTVKTMDLFKEIENYRNFIRQQSSDSQNSNKSDKSQTKVGQTLIKSQEVDHIDKKKLLDQNKGKTDLHAQGSLTVVKELKKIDYSSHSDHKESEDLKKVELNSNVEKEHQKPQFKLQNTKLLQKLILNPQQLKDQQHIDLNSQNSQKKQKLESNQQHTKIISDFKKLKECEKSKFNVKMEIDAQNTKEQHKADPKPKIINNKALQKSLKRQKIEKNPAKYQNLELNSQNSEKLTQTLQEPDIQPQTTNLSSQSLQNSQNSILDSSQSSQPSSSQDTSSSEPILGKRRRQINPKYSESEYLLKNTSREFTNAIRSKMMINKSQKTQEKDQGEASKPEDVAATSIAPEDHTIQPAFKCEVCSKTFLRSQGLARHVLMHSIDRRFICTICDYRFKQSSDLVRHMLTHEQSPSHPCPKCDEKFQSEKNLKMHMETHESLPYKCDQCEIRFRSTKNLRYHFMSHHSKVRFQCGYCGSKFSDEKSMRIHVMEHENGDGDLDDEELEDYLDFMDEEDEIDSDDEPMVIAE